MKVILTDIGGVLLSNGWDTACRKRASEHFEFDLKEFEERHRVIYDTYEEGKVSLQDYLDQAVFFKDRPFTPADFFAFMRSQSQAYQEMIELFREVKLKYSLKIGAISNEGQELGAYRVKKFELDHFIDFFVISGFFGTRKPDPHLFQIALSISQADIREALYIDDRPILAEIARTYGFTSLHHTSAKDTRKVIESFCVQNSL